MKKYLLLLVAVMLATIGRAAVGDTFEYDGLNYRVVSEDNDEVEVARNRYVSGDIVIPSLVNYDGIIYGVHSIAEEAFYSTSVTSVTIPNSVISIGAEAFRGCYELTSVTIPNSVTSIGEDAFYSCEGLASVTIPNSVTTIGDSAFGNCTGLSEINVEKGSKYFSSEDGVLYNNDKTTLLLCPGAKTECAIPETVITIGDDAFYQCFGLTLVTIPNSVTSIGAGAFSCSGLTSVAIPNSVITIGDSAFKDCSSLTSVTISNSVTSIGKEAFYSCSGLTSVTIPNSVTTIGKKAFKDCSSLTSVTIPNSVTTIGEYAFLGCTGLTSVTIPKSVTSIGDSAFGECPLAKVVNLNPTPQEIVYNDFYCIAAEAVLYVPSGSVDAYKAAEGWSVFSDIRGMGAFEIALSAETLEIAEGEYAKIDAKIVKDDDVTVESEEWSSSDTAVAVVKDGVVTAVAPGKAVITYTAVDSYGVPHTATCVVTVTEGQNSVSEIGYDADATVDVYTLQGVAVFRNAPATDIRTLPAGLYIIRQNNTTRKIAVK